jgi:hypothetical protein
MNWAIAESEGFRRRAMVDDDAEEDEEYQRYRAIKAAEEQKEQQRGDTAPASANAEVAPARGLPVAAGISPALKPERLPTRHVLEREHASRQSAVSSASDAARRRDGYFTAPSGPVAYASSEQGWEELSRNAKQQARETQDFLSQWGGVLR